MSDSPSILWFSVSLKHSINLIYIHIYQQYDVHNLHFICGLLLDCYPVRYIVPIIFKLPVHLCLNFIVKDINFIDCLTVNGGFYLLASAGDTLPFDWAAKLAISSSSQDSCKPLSSALTWLFSGRCLWFSIVSGGIALDA